MGDNRIKKSYEEPFSIVYHEVWDNEELTAKQRYVYLYLLRKANSMTSNCFPSLATICKKTGYGRSTVNDALKELEKRGLIIKKCRMKENGSKDSNMYYINHIKDLICSTNEYEGSTNEYEGSTNEYSKKKNLKIKNKNNKYVYKEDAKIKEFSTLYQSNIGVINSLVAEQLIEWSETLEVGLFKRALEICTEKGNLNLGYLKGIIKKWLDINITTLEKLEAHKLQNDIKKTNNKSISKNKENIPKAKKTRFHNINETFNKYGADELERRLKESQKDKFNW